MIYNLLIVIYGFIINLNNIHTSLSKKTINTHHILKFEEENYDMSDDYLNKTLSNVKGVEYDKENDMWIVDLETDINNVLSDIKENVEITANDDNFPSFNKFLENRKTDEGKTDVNKKIKTTSNDLDLIDPFIVIEWAKTWIYEMVHVPDFFPTFMFHDMYRMRDFTNVNKTRDYLYIGYYPKDVNLKKGPYYIGAFKIIPPKKELRTYILIQNPYFFMDDTYDDTKIINFKNELKALAYESGVLFKFDNLKDSVDTRYYYSWLFEDN
tara:strand:+ start:9804 stop:10607 length:804 start_codon:yes stop_codon:yes gene_type:complete